MPLFHRLLGLGMVALLGVLLIVRNLGIGPLLSNPQTFGLIFAGAAIVLVAVALLFLKPLVPERAPGQSIEQYWRTPDVNTKALRVWFVLEGGATLAAVGYFMTGEPVAAVASGLVIVVFWLCGPNVFAKP